MSKVAKSVGNIVKSPARTLAAVGTFGTSEISRKLPGIGNVQQGLERGADTLLGVKGPEYKPPQLAKDSAANLLAQTGGASLLTNIALGADIDSVLASYFGQNPSTWNAYIQNIPEAEYNAIIGVRNQLAQIQANTDLRNKAVQQVINDFPNIAQQSIAKQRELMQKDLAVFDDTTKAVLDRASSQLAAKYAATGGFSSGAFNEGLAKASTDVALDRANLAYGRSADISMQEGQIPIQQYQMRLAETNALRDFQNTMLGGGINQGFSAMQAGLQRNAGVDQFNAQARQQSDLANQQSKNALFGSLGGLAGTFLGAKMLGGGALFGAAYGATADPNQGFASFRSSGMASRAPGGVQQYRPF